MLDPDHEIEALEEAVECISRLEIIFSEYFNNVKEKERALDFLTHRFGDWVRTVAK